MERILDWNKYLDTAAKMVSEGIVMLKNENNALPLDADKEVAVFGRIQFHYYKSGTGSGGMVNVTKVVNILDGLIDNGVKVNEKLLDTCRTEFCFRDTERSERQTGGIDRKGRNG